MSTADKDTIQLAHGGGGLLSRDLVEKEILSRFGNGPLKGLPDAASLPRVDRPLAFTTDSFVVQPLEFPGGNIGDLAVHGTVNDLAVSGAEPAWLSLALIMEEGLHLAVLRRILNSVRAAAADCGVAVVTGDTKVVGRGQCDGLYINTSGIGALMEEFQLGPERIARDDAVLLSGTLGDHGTAVLACRESIDIRNGPTSDTAPVHRLVRAAGEFAPEVHFMRDPTRGGAAATLNEPVAGSKIDIMLHEADIPLSPGACAVSEMLGLDILHVASEGRVILFCSADAAPAILAKWHEMPEGRDAAQIGSIIEGNGRVILESVTGGHRIVSIPHGELLPRIC